MRLSHNSFDSGSASTTQPPVELAFDVAIADWDDLLGAVKARLRATAGGPLGAATGQPADRDAERSRTDVLDCVNALDQLHITLQHELARRERFEHEIADLQAELARAHTELLGLRCCISTSIRSSPSTIRVAMTSATPCSGSLPRA